MAFHSEASRAARPRLAQFLRRARRDEGGATAVEFAAVSMPFLMLVFGIIAAGLYFFTAFSIEHAAEQAARVIRTGAFKSANSNTGMTTQQFKQLVCDHAPSFVDCSGKVRVNTVVVPDNQVLDANTLLPSCTDGGGNIAAENSNNTDKLNVAGSTIVVVGVCYQFDLAAKIPFLKLGSMSGSNSQDAAMIRAAVTFRTEPYE